MGLIVQHSRNIAWYLAQSIILHNNESNTGRSQILLCTAVNADIFRNINRTRENIRWHIGNHRNRRVQILMKLRTINCIIGGDMEVIRIGRNSIIFRDIRIRCFRRRCHFYDFAKRFRFLYCFLRPNTGIKISSFLFKEVERHHTEFQAGATTQEQYRIPFRNV